MKTSFSISTPGHWSSRGGAETFNRLHKLLELRSQYGIEIPVKEVEKRGLKNIEDFSSSDFDTHKKEIIEELKNVEYNDLGDMVLKNAVNVSQNCRETWYKIYCRIVYKYTLAPGVYEIGDINLMLKSLLPDEVEVNITIDDFELKSNLTTNKTIRFTKKSFFHTILIFTQSHSGD